MNQLTEGQKDIIISIMVEQQGMEIKDIVPEASLTEDLGMDSLESVELIIDIEKEFSISIENEDAEKIVTVQDVFDCVAKYICTQ